MCDHQRRRQLRHLEVSGHSDVIRHCSEVQTSRSTVFDAGLHPTFGKRDFGSKDFDVPARHQAWHSRSEASNGPFAGSSHRERERERETMGALVCSGARSFFCTTHSNHAACRRRMSTVRLRHARAPRMRSRVELPITALLTTSRRRGGSCPP